MVYMGKMTFALYFGNRGFFPGELIASARKEMVEAVKNSGYGYIIMDENLTRYGAVETIKEGKLYAEFLEQNKGKYDGIILCLPNFGDENGASVALANAEVPILVQAYPDEAGKMDFDHRRDSVCGKIAMCNVLRQLKIKYTLTKRFAVSPLDDEFKEDLRIFAGICRAVKGLKSFSIGAIGARTTAFKTVRYDEIAMQNKRINIETIDLSSVFDRFDKVNKNKLDLKKKRYLELSDFANYPVVKLENIARLGAVIDDIIEEYNLQAVAIRCWDEIEKRYGIAPCLILGELNEKGIAAACELDINNAVMMRALYLAADYPVMLFDVNNNYGKDKDRCILFHCGPAPISMMKGKGTIKEHLMFKKSYGEGSGVGINVGEILEGNVTIGSFKTENGRLCSFVAEGVLEDGNIEKEFFGCKTVFRKNDVEGMLRYMAQNGYRHHVAITKGSWAESVREAFENYLDFETDIL
jgi:L-fucose isomerase-like protein